MSGSHDRPAAAAAAAAPSSSTSANHQTASTSSGGGSGRSGRQGANEFCSSCGTTTTPVWRRDGQGGLHCNACSLYIKTKGKPRPIHLESYTVKRRRARPQARAIAADASSSSAEGSYRAVSNPTPIVYEGNPIPTRYTEIPNEGRYGPRLAASYPYRDRSAERQTRGHFSHNHHQQPYSDVSDLPMPPLASLTRSTSMLESRTLPPLQHIKPSSAHHHNGRESE